MTDQPFTPPLTVNSHEGFMLLRDMSAAAKMGCLLSRRITAKAANDVASDDVNSVLNAVARWEKGIVLFEEMITASYLAHLLDEWTGNVEEGMPLWTTQHLLDAWTEDIKKGMPRAK